MESNKEYLGKNVKRKNLRGGYKYYIVIGFNDVLGYNLIEPKTNTTLNVEIKVFEKKFKILK